MKFLLDESGNNDTGSAVLLVGAVEFLDGIDKVEHDVVDLWTRLTSRGIYDGLPGFEQFKRHGFHASSDPVEVSGPFIDLMLATPFRAYLYVTDRTSTFAGADDTARIVYMYENLLADLLLRFAREPLLDWYFETNEELNAVFPSLPSAAEARALAKTRRHPALPAVDVHIETKMGLMSMAVVDYTMAAVHRWLAKGRPTDGSIREARAFREVEPRISILYSLEEKALVTRGIPLH